MSRPNATTTVLLSALAAGLAGCPGGSGPTDPSNPPPRVWGTAQNLTSDEPAVEFAVDPARYAIEIDGIGCSSPDFTSELQLAENGTYEGTVHAFGHNGEYQLVIHADGTAEGNLYLLSQQIDLQAQLPTASETIDPKIVPSLIHAMLCALRTP